MRPTPETDTENDTQCELAAWELLREARRERDEWAALCGRYKQERDGAREELVWVTRLVETIRDKAEIRYGGNTGFMAFSDLKDEARRSMRLGAAK